MRHTAIRISDSYAVNDLARARLGEARHRYGAAQVSPDEMGGYFDFIDWRGRRISQDDFRGRWTFLYFGYSRCRGSCREAAPTLAAAARGLRKKGIAARAAFVDIETPPVAPVTRIDAGARGHAHAVNWPMRYAMAQLYRDHRGQMDVFTGSRAQLTAATQAYHVLREHVPPAPGENGMSINHSSTVYLIGPDTLIAAYGYHDMGAAALQGLVHDLSLAERRTIDLEAARARYLRGACGGEV